MSVRRGATESGTAPAPTRVASRDGTEIACWTTGEGPPLVLVHGTPADHTRWRPLLPHLEPHATVHAIDRRGRGASGDAASYDISREYEDVAAVVDAVAEASGSAVDVYGHSAGGIFAVGAAALTSGIRKLVLYEGWPLTRPEAYAFPPGVEARMDAMFADGNREAALETFVREVIMASEDELNALRSQPSWPARVAAVHTVTREMRAFAETRLDLEQAARIAVPTLLVTGADSPDPAKGDVEALAAALPDARVAVIEGQGHLADILIPDVFAGTVLAFLRDPV